MLNEYTYLPLKDIMPKDPSISLVGIRRLGDTFKLLVKPLLPKPHNS